jgi:fructan beta-fructosidase
MVAFWSRNDNRSQCISYSLDHGRSWKNYDNNPVLSHPDRDPKVFWYAPGNRWVMLLYGGQHYHIFTSQNLLNWKDEQKAIPNSYECPDIFELPVDGKNQNKKWVLIRGDGKYSVGDFDGSAFKEETSQLVCDIGPNFYATQTWTNTETGDGRKIQAAWMRDGVYPDMPFNQQITFPCELTLHTTPDGMRLFRNPIHEISLLQKRPDSWKDHSLSDGATLPLETTGDLFHIQAEFSIPEKATLTFNLLGAELVLTSKTITSGKAHASVVNPIKTVEILVDRTSIEAFINHGELSASRCILPKGTGVSLKAEGDQVVIHSLTVFPLTSAWEKE